MHLQYAVFVAVSRCSTVLHAYVWESTCIVILGNTRVAGWNVETMLSPPDAYSRLSRWSKVSSYTLFFSIAV
jgi:hypothetical protein